MLVPIHQSSCREMKTVLVTRKWLSVLLVSVALCGCKGGGDRETLSVRHLAGSLTAWTSPYLPPPVERDLDGTWEGVGPDGTLFRALLPERVWNAGGIPSATVTAQKGIVPLEVFAGAYAVGEGATYLDCGDESKGDDPGLPALYLRQAEGQGPPQGISITYRPRGVFVDQYAGIGPAKDLKDMPGPWRYYQVLWEPPPPPRGQPQFRHTLKEAVHALPMPPPAEARFRFGFAGTSSLSVAFGVVCPTGKWPEGDITFDLQLTTESAASRVGQVTLSPAGTEGHRRWVHRTYDLSAFRGGEGELVVSCRAGGGGEGSASGDAVLPLLSEPILVTPPSKPDEVRNVVLVSLDTLRADHLGCYGYGRPTSPALDAFAAENIQFDAAIAQNNWTLPSHVSMLTSLYASRHGVLEAMQSFRDLTTTASLLKRGGFQTKAVTDGAFLNPEYGFCLGFDSYEAHGNSGFQTILPAAEAWLRGGPGEPFFLFLHTYDPHSPFHPPKPFRDRFPPSPKVAPELANGVASTHLPPRETEEERQADLQHTINMYDACIMYTDEGMGHLFDLLRELGLWEKTVIIVTADHGEQFMEHGYIGHGNHFYEEVIRVPFLVHLPEGPSGRKVGTVVQLIDIPPTIFDYLGLGPQAGFQGGSVLSLLSDDEPDEERIAYSEQEDEIARRTLSEKLIHSLDVDRTELYDLLEDPEEKRNLVDLDSDHTQELVEDVLSFRELNESLREEATSRTFELPEEVEEQLRNLGYLQGGRTGRGAPEAVPSSTGEGGER